MIIWRFFIYRKPNIFLRCSGLEKKLSDTNTEKETLKTKIIQVELKQEDDRKTRNEEEKRRKDENIQFGSFNWSRVNWNWTINESPSDAVVTKFVSYFIL